MCGIAGLFSKSSGIEEKLGSHLSAMLGQLAIAGPTARESRSTATRPAGPGQGVALLRGRRLSVAHARGGLARRSARSEPERGPRTRCSRSRARAGGTALARRPSPRAAGDERRRADRDLQGSGRPSHVRRATSSSPGLGHARARPYADGDGEQGHDRALAPVLDRPRPLPGSQRVALEPQPAARRAAPRGDRVPDRQRLGGRRRLPDLADARGDHLETALDGLPRRISTASTRSRSAPPTASRCCATRSRASRR